MRRRRHRSLLYVVYLHSPLWRLRRRIWIVRAGGRCQRCRSRRRLTIHHRTYQRLGHERRADVTVLCWDCHRRHHNPPRRSLWRRGVSSRIDARARSRRHASPRVSRSSPGHLALLALIAVAAVVVATTLLAKR
jgi:HNH endonuclease